MAPATRLSGTGLGASSYAQGIDGILNQYHEFKRKHIAQNRQIIKTNAELQIRHRDLERRIQTLEAQRNDLDMERIHLQAGYDRAQQALRGVAKGWQYMARSMTDLGLVGHQDPTTGHGIHYNHLNDEQQGDATPRLGQKPPLHLERAKRITLDANALPPNDAVRRVARPPNLLYGDLIEQPTEEVEEASEGHGSFCGGTEREEVGIDGRRRGKKEGERGEEGEAEETRDDDDTIRVLAPAFEEQAPVKEYTRDLTRERESHGDGIDSAVSKQRVAPAKRAARRSSGFNAGAQPTAGDATVSFNDSGDEETERTLRPSSSVDSLSSFVDDGEIQLSEEDEEQEEDDAASYKEPRVVSIHAVQASPSANVRPSPSSQATAASRKRKVASSPKEQRQSTQGKRSPSSSVTGDEDTEEDRDENEGAGSSSSSSSRRSARSSVRSRSSVNYALPKLNTKMRKPDPVELVPAGVFDVGRERNNSSSRESENGPHGATAPRGSRTASGKGDKRKSAASAGQSSSSSSSSSSTTPLRGAKNGIASSGNLSDLRKQHEEKKEKAQAQERQYEAAASDMETENDSEDDTVTMQPSSVSRNTVLQHRGPRKSSGRKSSPSKKSKTMGSSHSGESGREEEEDGENSAEERREREKRARREEAGKDEEDRGTGGDDEYESDGRSVDKHTLTHQHSANSKMQQEGRTPLARTTDNGSHNGSGTESYDGLFKPASTGSAVRVAGTPIPRSTSTFMATTSSGKNIKALQLAAGRLPSTNGVSRPKTVSRTPSSEKTPPLVGQQRPTSSSSSSSSSYFSEQSQARGQDLTGKQRSSLHAAMTNP